MESWTKGPWEANGTAVETVSTPSAVIGSTYDEREDCGIESEAEALANARLMAAAPDLYMALVLLRTETTATIATTEVVSAALRKARGETA